MVGFSNWRRYGESGVLLEFESASDVFPAYLQLQHLTCTDECVPGAVTIYLESTSVTIDALIAAAEESLRLTSRAASSDAAILRTHTIDVTYDGADLGNVASLTGLPVDDVIEIHSTSLYTVAFLGFSRSFPYLAGLDPRIIVPRLASPRTSVPAGSVGIGAGYTGIYPMSSPGGWQLLGHTDAQLFDETSDPPSFLATGDRVKFRAV
jgi:KipI family sensor histidine kinase inhibitor